MNSAHIYSGEWVGACGGVLLQEGCWKGVSLSLKAFQTPKHCTETEMCACMSDLTGVAAFPALETELTAEFSSGWMNLLSCLLSWSQPFCSINQLIFVPKSSSSASVISWHNDVRTQWQTVAFRPRRRPHMARRRRLLMTAGVEEELRPTCL